MQRLARFFHFIFFFFLGAIVMATLLVCLFYLIASFTLQNRVYPGVKIAGRDVSLLTAEEIESSFPDLSYASTSITLTNPLATISATGSNLSLALDKSLMSRRALSIGRQTKNPYYNFLQIIAAWQDGFNLPLEINFDRQALNSLLDPIAPKIEKPPVDAIFKFVPAIGPDGRGRVQAFQPSESGISLDRERIAQNIITKAQAAKQTAQGSPSITIPLYTKSVAPSIKSSTADDMGILDLIGSGVSYFSDSIPGRVHNIGIATSQIHGRLIPPEEIFSFSQSIGTVSAVFGYQKAYAIIKNKTVLDDGGGVCQVSTTVYRAVLNSGLPIIERAPHTYRVSFYEQGGFKPGLDATVYPPSPDLKFQNDTGNWILIQTSFDKSLSKLTIEFFGTSDGRKTEIRGPFITSTTPAPEPIYENDPNLPAGEIKQVDTAHPGAAVYFERKVTRGTEVLISETVKSNYVPWPARYLRGTKV